MDPKAYVSPRGIWNAYCQVCHFKFKSNELRKRWDGLWVCEEDWEPKHPIDFPYTPKQDNLAVGFVFDQDFGAYIGPPLNLTTAGCSAIGQLAHVDCAEVDCAIIDNVNIGLQNVPQ